MDPTFYPALFGFLDHALLAGVFVWLVLRYPSEIRDLLNRLREAGPKGLKFDPFEDALDQAAARISTAKKLRRGKAPSQRIADSIKEAQGSLDEAKAIIVTVNATELPDTANITGTVGE